MSIKINNNLIKEWAREVGFDLVGISPAEPIATAEHFRKYLARGYCGTMQYLQHNGEKRIDPRQIISGARSIICVAVNYFNAFPEESEEDNESGDGPLFGRLARYAWGLDYHRILKSKLHQLCERIRSAVTPVQQFCCFDSGPLAEKAHAARAGLGWIGKNGLLVNEEYGSWLVLGEIVTDLELEYDEPVAERCGDCKRCLEACPTAAFLEARILDARRCISYLTTEYRAEVPCELADEMGDWLLGCDLCQEVCPFNQDVPTTRESGFEVRWSRLNLDKVLALNDEKFKQHYAETSIVRVGWEHFIHIAQNCRRNLTSKSTGD